MSRVLLLARKTLQMLDYYSVQKKTLLCDLVIRLSTSPKVPVVSAALTPGVFVCLTSEQSI